MSEQNREHLAFVAVMNALDVHMPPDGAALLTELRAIAATVGYPWRGAPLTAGPVAPPPDPLTRYQADLLSDWRCAQHSMMCECHPGREWPHDECPGPGMPWIIEGRTLIEEVLGEAPRGAARPPQPTLEQLAQHLGWGAMSAEQAFGFAVRREQLLRVAQTLLETHKSDAPDAEAAIRDRVQTLTAARPPASPPALEALIAKYSVWHRQENICSCQMCAKCREFADELEAVRRALAVPPEAPPP